MRQITEYVKQVPNFHFPRVVNEYLSTKVVPTKIKATNKTIHKIVKDELDRLGHDADLNHIDVIEVTRMNGLFGCDLDFYLGTRFADLNPDISNWDVSNVEDMYHMFWRCKKFNKDISKWNVCKAKDMGAMFYECDKFNQDLSQWNVSKVKNMAYMFEYCENFNKDLSRWDVGKVEDMYAMFNGCINFNQDLSKWDVSNVEEYENIFKNCPIEEEFKPKFKI